MMWMGMSVGCEALEHGGMRAGVGAWLRAGADGGGGVGGL